MFKIEVDFPDTSINYNGTKEIQIEGASICMAIFKNDKCVVNEQVGLEITGSRGEMIVKTFCSFVDLEHIHNAIEIILKQAEKWGDYKTNNK